MSRASPVRLSPLMAAFAHKTDNGNGQGPRLLLHDPPYSLRKVVEMFPDECAAREVAA